MPMTSASTTSSARSSSSSSWTSTSTSRSSARASRVQRARGRGRSSAATISRIASAPADRGLDDLVGVDDEVLAQDRQAAGRARLAQVVERAAEVGPSVSTDSAAAPAALVGARRCPSTVAPARICPALGERRLCSAMTDMPGPRERLGERAVRRRARPARRSSSASGTLAAAAPTSSRVDVDDALEHAHDARRRAPRLSARRRRSSACAAAPLVDRLARAASTPVARVGRRAPPA